MTSGEFMCVAMCVYIVDALSGYLRRFFSALALSFSFSRDGMGHERFRMDIRIGVTIPPFLPQLRGRGAGKDTHGHGKWETGLYVVWEWERRISTSSLSLSGFLFLTVKVIWVCVSRAMEKGFLCDLLSLPRSLPLSFFLSLTLSLSVSYAFFLS